MAIDPAWIALVGTICGGVGLKMAEHWLGRAKIKQDDALQIRNELRLEITSQRDEIRELETNLNKSKDDYYQLYEKYIKLQTELTMAVAEIKALAGTVSESAPPGV